jgi:FMN-binding domain
MNSKNRILFGSASVLALAVPAPVVIAAEYLSVESAQRSAFAQADQFTEVTLTLTTSQRQTMLALAGPQPPHGRLRSWRATQNDQLLGYFFTDEVIGRQDLITYAISIDASGKLGAVEILAYRESHGAEIKNSAWRKQFSGRNNLANLRFATDIKNIAGATMSCEHVTQGVRWVLTLWQTLLNGQAS